MCMCVCVDLCCLSAAEGEGSFRDATRCGEKDLWNGSSKLSPFFQKWFVLKDTHRPQEQVCMWVSAAEVRITEGRALYVTGERQTPFLTSRLVRWTLSFRRVVPGRDWVR